EDNADDIFLLEQAIKKAGVGLRLHTANDGLEAIAYLTGDGVYSDRSAHPLPDFILLDLNMPRMHGFELLEWLRREPKCSRLMVHGLTASARVMEMERAYDLGANSYLVKPSRMTELVELAGTLHGWHRLTMLPRCAEDNRPVISAL